MGPARLAVRIIPGLLIVLGSNKNKHWVSGRAVYALQTNGDWSVIMGGEGEGLEVGRCDASGQRASSCLPLSEKADGKATEMRNTPELIDLQMHICSLNGNRFICCLGCANVRKHLQQNLPTVHMATWRQRSDT